MGLLNRTVVLFYGAILRLIDFMGNRVFNRFSRRVLRPPGFDTLYEACLFITSTAPLTRAIQAGEPGCGVAAHQQPRNARKLLLLGLNPLSSYSPFFHTATAWLEQWSPGLDAQGTVNDERARQHSAARPCSRERMLS